jgi:glucose/arabinose dehydrogenase
MTWLPDGSLLLKNWHFIPVVKGVKTEIKNVPKVYVRGQGGLLDALYKYSQNGWIYLSYASDEGRNWRTY